LSHTTAVKRKPRKEERVVETHSETPAPLATPASTPDTSETPASLPLLKVSDDTIERLTETFKMLADASRLKIVMLLAQEGPMHVSALCKHLRQTQPAISHHLTLMRMAGIVRYKRDGKHNFYHLASAYLAGLFEQFFEDTDNENQVLDFDEFSLTFSREE